MSKAKLFKVLSGQVELVEEELTVKDWLTSRGERTPVANMEDTHLFFTLRLIWNSMMPLELSVGTYKSAYFKPTLYTTDYWKGFLPVLYAELHSRSELPRRYKEQLANMQIEHLLARVSTSAALKESLADMFERDEDTYVPEVKGWDSEKGEQI